LQQARCAVKYLFLLFLFSVPCGWRLSAQKLYVAEGKASFYAKKFDGRKTANGEKFSNKEFTAAHRTLPFGTYVKVTNLRNNKWVLVRINDRGPYVKGRIIDLTQAAADSLDFRHSGWVNVRVEEVPPPPAVTKPAPVVYIDNEPAFQFPKDWIGDWKGELKIYNQQGFQRIIPMELRIYPAAITGRYSWQIKYDTSLRDYELVTMDSALNHYAIDEKDGIIIQFKRLGNQLAGRFEVENTLLECVYEMQHHDEITMQIRAGDFDHHFTTGNIWHETDSVPPVRVYDIGVLQKARLCRQPQ
jgi:hypothetical protein